MIDSNVDCEMNPSGSETSPPDDINSEKPEIDDAIEEALVTKNPFDGLIYYVPGKKPTYYIKNNDDGSWILRDEAGLKRWMAAEGISTAKQDRQLQSEADKMINTIQLDNVIEWVGDLAGYSQGIHEVGGKKILILHDPKLIIPGKTGISTIMSVLQSMFLINDDPIQFLVFLNWLSYAVKARYSASLAPGQALVLVGPRNAMKTFTVNHIIAKLFGDRVAKPIDYMVGSTRFNDDLLSSEIQLIDDEVYSPSSQNRRKFGSAIKKLTSNEGVRCEKKFCDPVWLTPFWRLIVCVNDEADNVSVLPPLDPSMEDKVIILKVNECYAPMPTETKEQRVAFRETIYGELPGFLSFLLKMEIPKEARSGRFGIKPYHNPEIIEVLGGLQPEAKLLKFMVEALCKTRTNLMATPYRSTGITFDGDAVEGKASDLESYVRILLPPSMSRIFDNMMQYSTAFAVLLQRLAIKYPETIQKLPARRGWRIDKNALLACL